jgi:hypothetical protein
MERKYLVFTLNPWLFRVGSQRLRLLPVMCGGATSFAKEPRAGAAAGVASA